MFVSYRFAREPYLPPMPQCLYEYVVGAGGIFVRARRPGLEALIWVASTAEPLRGLAEIRPYVRISSLVPARQLERMLLTAYRAGHKETLFYLRSNLWQVFMPAQVQSAGGVHPVDPYAGGTDTILEVHSHHTMPACFSPADNREERAGFRLFAVIGRLDSPRPQIRVRVGIYGHFWEIPAGWVFELPSYVEDARQPEMRYEEAEEYA